MARARGVAKSRVEALLDDEIEGRDLFVFGEPRANVLDLNLALDARFGPPAQQAAAR